MLASPARRLWLTLAVIVLIGVGFVYFVDLRAVGRQLVQANPTDMALASATLLAGLVTYALRWHALLAMKSSRARTFHIANLGHVTNIFIPARLGEAARILVMGREPRVSTAEAASSFVLERVFEQVMRLGALLAALSLGAGLANTGQTLLGGVVFLVATMAALIYVIRARDRVVVRWPRHLARLPRLTEASARQMLVEWLDNMAAVARPRLLLIVLFWSIVNWLLFLGYHFFTWRALDLGLDAGQAHLAILLSLAVAPPSAPTQPGIYHLSIVGPLSVVGLPEGPSTAYATLLHALQILWMLPLGLIGLRASGMSLRGIMRASHDRDAQATVTEQARPDEQM